MDTSNRKTNKKPNFVYMAINPKATTLNIQTLKCRGEKSFAPTGVGLNEIIFEKNHNFILDMVMNEITYLSKSNSLQCRGEKFFALTEKAMNKEKKMSIQTSFLEKSKKPNFVLNGLMIDMSYPLQNNSFSWRNFTTGEEMNKITKIRSSYKKFPGETNFEKKSNHEKGNLD